MTDTTPLQQSHFQERDDSFARRLGQKAIHTLDWLFGRFSLVGDCPIHDPDQFSWVKALEAHTDVMREELDRILQYREVLPSFHDITAEVSTISQDDLWKTYFFYGYGEKAKANCARCPRTTELIERVPGMTTAFFSILSAGKHIPAHRGPYKGVLRYHLGLKVPEPAAKCRIRVADQVVYWKEGESIVFDDTYNHEVWNETNGERAILFLDVKRPLPPSLSYLNDFLIGLAQYTSIVRNAQENQKQWAEHLEQAEAHSTRNSSAGNDPIETTS